MTKGEIVIMEFLVGLISNVPVITENKQTQVNSLVNIPELEEQLLEHVDEQYSVCWIDSLTK